MIEEEKNELPMFAHRAFTIDGTDIASVNSSERWSTNHCFVIDGQQRLQSFYIGLLGTYNSKELYFNLNSDAKNLDFDFRFSADREKLPKTDTDSLETKRPTIWCSVKSLYKRLKRCNDEDQVTDEYLGHYKIHDPATINVVSKCIKRFYRSIVIDKAIGISKVHVNRTLDATANRQRIVELFRRLNDGGTKLSAFDLVASVLKGYEWTMEAFLDETLAAYGDLGLGQDELLKLFFLLQDDHAKEVSDIEPSDAEYVAKNRSRIENALKGMVNFLHASRFYEYFRAGNRSAIPLYFICYYLFHSKYKDSELESLFNRFDTQNIEYKRIYSWLVYSLLNSVFKSRGAGWIPYKTGVRKILLTLKGSKGVSFPAEKLFKVYENHPLTAFTLDITIESLCSFDQEVLFYLLYNGARVFRPQDIDHIHPRSILIKKGADWSKINSLPNYQLIESGTNRNEKNDKELSLWIQRCVTDSASYCDLHLIPNERRLWSSDNFEQFYDSRKLLVLNKIKKAIMI